MSILDINKAMAAYSVPTEFDQNAWKKAFDIANAFTTAENNRATANENQRKYQENLATQDWRVAYSNAQNQAGVSEQQNKLAQAQALSQNWDLLRQYGVDENGRFRTPEELFNIGRSQQNLSPALLAQLYVDNQKHAQEQAQLLAPYNPHIASQYRVMAGLTDNMVDSNGNLVNFNSDTQLNNAPLTAEQQAALAAGYNPNAKQAELTWQQKQDYQHGQTVLNNLQKDLGRIMSLDGIMIDNKDLTGKVVNQQLFNQQITNLANIYQNNPQALQIIRNYANEAARQHGWSQ